MAYSTLDDIKKLVPEQVITDLTDDEGIRVVNQVRVDEAIAQADAEVDSYCATRYAVPFSAVPDIVKKCSVDIAIYNLYSRTVEELPQTRADRYRNAMRQLEGIAKGVVSLGEDPPPSAASQTSQRAEISADDRAFGRDKLKDF